MLLACSLIALPENFAHCDGGSQQQGVRDLKFLPASGRKRGPIISSNCGTLGKVPQLVSSFLLFFLFLLLVGFFFVCLF